MKNLGHRFTFLLSLIAVLLCACNCFEAGNHRTAKNLSAVILDESGRPIEGALFYVEAYTHKSGVFDFAFGFAGAEGEVPAAGKPPLEHRLAQRRAFGVSRIRTETKTYRHL